MTRIALLASVALFAATPAFAADEVMTSRYGNTTVATYADGTQQKIQYAADHSFTATQAGVPFKGTWKIDNGTICLTIEGTVPAGTPNPSCAPVVERKVGETWTVTVSGRPATVTLAAGKQ